MTDENDDEPGVNDETVMRNPNEGEESGGGPTVPTGSDDDPSGGQGGPSVPTGSSEPQGQGQSGGQGQPGGGNQPSSGGQGGPSVPGGGQNQPTTGQAGGGQAQPAGGATETAAGTASGSGGGTGLDPNIAGALGYLFAPLGGIVMYVVEDDEFARFHAKQGILFGVLMIGAWIGLFVFNFLVGFVFDAIGVGVLNLLWGLISFLLYPLVGLVGFVAWAFLTYKAYSGDRFQIPLIGGLVA